MCDRIDAAALDRCIAGPDRDSRRGGFGRLDVTSAFTPEDERVYTTSDVFAAETRLLAAHDPLVTTGR